MKTVKLAGLRAKIQTRNLPKAKLRRSVLVLSIVNATSTWHNCNNLHEMRRLDSNQSSIVWLGIQALNTASRRVRQTTDSSKINHPA
jgi:hypothetical protein